MDAGPVPSSNYFLDDFDLPQYPQRRVHDQVGASTGDLPDPSGARSSRTHRLDGVVSTGFGAVPARHAARQRFLDRRRQRRRRQDDGHRLVPAHRRHDRPDRGVGADAAWASAPSARSTPGSPYQQGGHAARRPRALRVHDRHARTSESSRPALHQPERRARPRATTSHGARWDRGVNCRRTARASAPPVAFAVSEGYVSEGEQVLAGLPAVLQPIASTRMPTTGSPTCSTAYPEPGERDHGANRVRGPVTSRAPRFPRRTSTDARRGSSYPRARRPPSWSRTASSDVPATRLARCWSTTASTAGSISIATIAPACGTPVTQEGLFHQHLECRGAAAESEHERLDRIQLHGQSPPLGHPGRRSQRDAVVGQCLRDDARSQDASGSTFAATTLWKVADWTRPVGSPVPPSRNGDCWASSAGSTTRPATTRTALRSSETTRVMRRPVARSCPAHLCPRSARHGLRRCRHRPADRLLPFHLSRPGRSMEQAVGRDHPARLERSRVHRTRAWRESLDSGVIEFEGGSFTLAFPDSGTFDYLCLPPPAAARSRSRATRGQRLGARFHRRRRRSVGFAPTTVVIRPGGYVRWANTSAMNHTVTSDYRCKFVSDMHRSSPRVQRSTESRATREASRSAAIATSIARSRTGSPTSTR